MYRSRTRYAIAGLFVSLMISCHIKPPNGGPTTTIQPMDRCDPKAGYNQPPITAIGIEVKTRCSGHDVRPYRAHAKPGDTIQWFSVSGDLDIQWLEQENPAPINDPVCPGPQGQRRVCSVTLNLQQPPGKYLYWAYVTTPDGVVTLNQPEVWVP